jgi:hypothetical protein
MRADLHISAPAISEAKRWRSVMCSGLRRITKVQIRDTDTYWFLILPQPSLIAGTALAMQEAVGTR